MIHHTNTVSIILDVPEGEIEEFDKNDSNVLQVRVQVPSGEMSCGAGYKVEITLSRDAMLGLGTELIRAAHQNSKETKFWHLRPSEKNLAVRAVGVYLHPKSCELIIAETEHGTLQEILDRCELKPSV